MAKKDSTNPLDSSASAVYKMDSTLDREANTLDEIVAALSTSTVKKYGVNAPGGKLVSFFNQISVHNIYRSGEAAESESIKDAMQRVGGDLGLANSLIDQSRIETLANYETIYNLIPECSLGVETYVSNILSPDDFTKTIFNIEYDSNDNSDDEKSTKQKVIETAHKLVKQYDLNRITEEYVSKAIRQSEAYLAVLGYDEEFRKMVNSSGSTILTEEYDAEGKTHPFLESLNLKEIKYGEDTSNGILTESAISEPLCNYFGVTQSKDSDKKELLKETYNKIAQCVDDNVKICKSSDILKEASEMYNDFGKFIKHDTDINSDDINKQNGNKTKGKKNSTLSIDNQFKINGSIIRELDSQKVIPLIIDKIEFGYFYIEYDNGPDTAAGSVLNLKGNVVNSNVPSSAFGVAKADTVETNQTYNSPASKMLGASDEMLMFVSKIFLDAISKKIDKNVINSNKQFKDIIYQLVKQDYIRTKQIRITYFSPDEMVAFKTDSIFENITFYAKLYLAVLTNDVIIKLGKSHDKRVYYVKVGNDKNQNAVVQQVIRNIKTKEFTYGNLGTLNSILSNSSGAGDDYFIPVTPNGDRAVDIETLPGMNADENKELLDFIKDSIINGMGLPTAVIADRQQNIEFARNITQQNIQMSRRVVRKQSDLQPSFTKLMRILISNELKYNLDAESESLKDVDLNKLSVSFPSPMSLNLTNMLEQSTSVGQMADFIIDTVEPAKQDGTNNDKRMQLRKEVVKKLMPGIDWSGYESMVQTGEIEENKAKLKDKRKSKVMKTDPDANQDPYGGGGMPY